MPVFQKQRKTLRTVIRELVDRANSDTNRIRILEQSYEALLGRINALEQEVMGLKKQILNLEKTIDMKLDEKEKRIARIEMALKEIAVELNKCAKKSDIMEIKSFSEMYNPLKSNFVTKDELRRMLGKK